MQKIYQFYTILLMMSFSIPQLMNAQSKQGLISGQVIQENGIPLAGVFIQVIDNDQIININSNKQGFFSITVPPGKTYNLTFRYVGLSKQSITINLIHQEKVELLIKLKTEERLLQEINIVGKNETQKAKEQIIKAQIIETKAAQQQAASLVEIMNRSVGVRIRQSGGLGSNSNIMLNGFQGKSIKTLKDGIPTDYLGASFNLTNIPASMIEHIEVYKGVLPPHLGSDALGGAINFVSRIANKPYLATSYEIASFKTHRFSVSHFQRSKLKKLFMGFDAFYNYSANNYQVTASIPDEETANVRPEKIKLFHNSYKQWYVELYQGWKEVNWADEFRIGIISYAIHRDNQFAALMEKPFGASFAKQEAPIIPTIRYKKSFFSGKVKWDQFIVYSKIKNDFIDTLSGSYDWYGKYHPAVDAGNQGESASPSLARQYYSTFTTRTGLNILLSEAHSLGMNIVFSDFNRKGTDPFGPVSAGENPIDLLSLPADYTKLIATTGLTSTFLHKKVQNLAQVKFFQAKAIGQAINLNTGKLQDLPSSARSSSIGLAEAIKWDISPSLLLRLSTELATRLPEQSEIMGDGSFGLVNFNLKPEKSINGNLGFAYTKQPKFGAEINGFYRITKDLILNVPVNLIFSQSSNIEQVRGIGLETNVYVSPLNWVRLNGNFTYQDFRLYQVKEPSILYLEGARLRNVPYFFSNLGATFKFKNIVFKGDQFQGYWNFSYVHGYFLNYIPRDTEPDGFLGLWGKAKIDAPNMIPAQTNHSIGLLWIPKAKIPLSINIECKNLFDSPIYDNFRIQNSGRSFHLKLSYTLQWP